MKRGSKQWLLHPYLHKGQTEGRVKIHIYICIYIDREPTHGHVCHFLFPLSRIFVVCPWSSVHLEAHTKDEEEDKDTGPETQGNLFIDCVCVSVSVSIPFAPPTAFFLPVLFRWKSELHSKASLTAIIGHQRSLQNPYFPRTPFLR